MVVVPEGVRSMSRKPGLAQAYAVPSVLAVASLIGLISALMGDGLADWLSWLLLGGLCAVIGWAWAARRS